MYDDGSQNCPDRELSLTNTITPSDWYQVTSAAIAISLLPHLFIFTLLGRALIVVGSKHSVVLIPGSSFLYSNLKLLHGHTDDSLGEIGKAVNCGF